MFIFPGAIKIVKMLAVASNLFCKTLAGKEIHTKKTYFQEKSIFVYYLYSVNASKFKQVWFIQ